MTEDGYPDEQELERIRKWPPAADANSPGFIGLMDFIKPLWAYATNGYWDEYKTKGDLGNKTVFKLSTAGWSGNETIIEALQENRLFWIMCWYSSKRGGHYEFEVKNEEVKNEKEESWGRR